MKKITAFFLTVAIIGLASGVMLYYSQVWFIDPLYYRTANSVFLIAITMTAIVLCLYLIIKTIWVRFTAYNLFIKGGSCVFLDMLFLFVLIVPMAGFTTNEFLWHLAGVSIFCFFIPHVHHILSIFLKPRA